MEAKAEKTYFIEEFKKANESNFSDKANVIFTLAAIEGYIILSPTQYAESKCGSYILEDLLFPRDVTTLKHDYGAVFKAGLNLFPDWYTYHSEKKYFTIDQVKLCQAFIRTKELSKHNGTFYFGENETTDEEIKECLLHSLSILFSDPGQKIYGVFQVLKTLCKDDVKKGPKPRLTIDILANEITERGFDIRLNQISMAFDVFGETATGRTMRADDLVTRLHDELADRYKDTSFSTIEQYLGYIGREHKYNPVLDLLENTPYKGRSQVQFVFDMLGIKDDELSKHLLIKWLQQTEALLFNDNTRNDAFGADGVLTFVSQQGYGKTSFFRRLALKRSWFGEGETINDRDKDTSRRVITKWISELGEVGSTMRSDIDRLKAFVTQSEDSYRLPYGRNDIVSPRHTSLCASCNDDRYLLDPTGNRRWWTIPINKRITREELMELDPLQLWAEVYENVSKKTYEEKAACFRLSPDEVEALEKRNGKHEKMLKGQAEIEDIIEQARRDGLVFKEMTCSEFKDMWPVLRSYSTQQIGQVLNKVCGNAARTKAGRFYTLPGKEPDQDNPFTTKPVTSMTTPMTTKN